MVLCAWLAEQRLVVVFQPNGKVLREFDIKQFIRERLRAGGLMPQHDSLGLFQKGLSLGSSNLGHGGPQESPHNAP